MLPYQIVLFCKHFLQLFQLLQVKHSSNPLLGSFSVLKILHWGPVWGSPEAWAVSQFQAYESNQQEGRLASIHLATHLGGERTCSQLHCSALPLAREPSKRQSGKRLCRKNRKQTSGTEGTMLGELCLHYSLAEGLNL